MTAWLAKVEVTLKPVVNDPEGTSIANALGQLGFEGVGDVRAGKYFEIDVQAASKEAATTAVDAMCRRLLANPVIEDYRFTVRQRGGRRRRP